MPNRWGIPKDILFTVFLLVGSLSAQSTDVKKLIQQANQGNAIAQCSIGVMYGTGRGVPQDDVQAVKWFRLAADQGLAKAQSHLGFMYLTGRGVPQDDVQAVKWVRLAADQGDAESQCTLGFLYYDGQGVPQDYVQAMKWFNLAAAQGDENGKMVRDLAAVKMTPQQIERAQELARNWKPKK